MFGSDGSCWVGLVWFSQFGSVQVLTEPVRSESEVVAGSQAVLVQLAVRLVDVYSVGRASVCFETLATAVFSGGCINSTTLYLMFLGFSASAFHHHNVMDVVVTYRLPLHLTGGIQTSLDKLFICAPGRMQSLDGNRKQFSPTRMQISSPCQVAEPL